MTKAELLKQLLDASDDAAIEIGVRFFDQSTAYSIDRVSLWPDDREGPVTLWVGRLSRDPA